MTDRAISRTLSYVLTLGIATLLVAGLIVAGGTFVEDRREQVIRQELRVIGEHVASNVDQVDRYARASTALETARLDQTFPTSVTGSAYSVKLLDPAGGQSRLVLNATEPRISVAVDVSAVNDLADGSRADGGPVRVRCTVDGGQCQEIQIANA